MPSRRASLASWMAHFGSGGQASRPAAISDWLGKSTIAPTPKGTTACDLRMLLRAIIPSHIARVDPQDAAFALDIDAAQ